MSDLKRSLKFYEPLFSAIGWRKLGDTEFSSGDCIVYFVEKPVKHADSAGPRHICFQAGSRNVVDQVKGVLSKMKADVVRGPVEMPDYSADYYTIDFRDPDAYVIEVAHTPNMKL